MGKAGLAFAKAISERGAKVVALSDSSGIVQNPDGLDLDRLAKQKAASQISYDGDRDDILSIESDILCLAALGDSIDANAAEQVRSKVIIEIANSAISPDADEALRRKDVKVGPDILFNAGGVVASYLEWAAFRAGGAKLVGNMEDLWRDRLTLAGDGIANLLSDTNGDWRVAAEMCALRELNTVAKAQSYFKS
jgi:glutamate dehydrogenase (NADP+)